MSYNLGVVIPVMVLIVMLNRCVLQTWCSVIIIRAMDVVLGYSNVSYEIVVV